MILKKKVATQFHSEQETQGSRRVCTGEQQRALSEKLSLPSAAEQSVSN